MPGPGLHEEAFLSLVKRLQKGKGKETNVSTNFRSWSPKNEYRSPREIPPVQPEAVEATSLHERPATVGAQDESQMDQEETFSGVFEEVQQQAIYTVIGSNFAPGTTADDIELALFPVSGKMEGCRITTYLPSVTAEMVFTHEARAENVIATFNNRKVSPFFKLLRSILLRPSLRQMDTGFACSGNLTTPPLRWNLPTPSIVCTQSLDLSCLPTSLMDIKPQPRDLQI